MLKDKAGALWQSGIVLLAWNRLVRESVSCLLLWLCVLKHYILTWTQCYQTFFVRNLRIFVISQSVCSQQAFSAQSTVCGLGQEPTQEKGTLQVFHLCRLWSLTVNIGLGWKACQGQTLQLITKMRKLLTIFFDNIGPRSQSHKTFWGKFTHSFLKS